MWSGEGVRALLDVDRVVVGAGAMGLAYADALVDHDPDVRVAIVDRRDGPGGHWRRAYPFVRLHQSSTFYGVASRLLGGGRIQADGPEAGLHERADQPTIVAYYDEVLARLVATGRVVHLPRSEYDDARGVVSLDTGARLAVPPGCRVVDARYLSPDIPAETPRRYAVDGARVVTVDRLPAVEDEPRRYVVLGSGKTATDAVVWLLGRGVDPDRVCWVRPRDPWMLDRARIQPVPEIYLAMVADLLEASATAASLPALFLRLEELGVMHRIDRAVTPTMAKAPTLGAWELELLRTVEDVVRLGHVRRATRTGLELEDGTVAIPPDTLVVDCAADGLKQPPRIPVWTPDRITLQPVRAGFPCFGAALLGYVDATRDSDRERNRLCPPSSYGNTLGDWAAMNVLGMRASAAFDAEPDVRAFADRVALNPARVPPGHPASPALDDARARLAQHTAPGLARLAELAGLAG